MSCRLGARLRPGGVCRTISLTWWTPLSTPEAEQDFGGRGVRCKQGAIVTRHIASRAPNMGSLFMRARDGTDRTTVTVRVSFV